MPLTFRLLAFRLLALRLLVVSLIGVSIVGCAPRQQAEVVERKVLTQREQDERIGGQYIRIVQPGDTLYSITFAAGLDVNKVAAWNGIADTSKLAAGKRIRLTEPLDFKERQAKAAQARVAKQRAAKKSEAKKRAAQKRARAVAKNKANVPSATKAVATSKNKPLEPVATSRRNPTTGTSKPLKSRPSKAVHQGSQWGWPLRGTLVNRFNPSGGQKGINIQGQLGQPIKATASGEVVYAGDSLKGYGNLIIIKHSSTYLSAYANNRSITVQEGQFIEQGQVIANLGTNSEGSAVSQFQIRKNGDPVDPMAYLN